MARHQERETLLTWLRSNDFRNPTKEERQLIARELGCTGERVRVRTKALRYEFGETASSGILPDKASIIQDWVSSNDQRLDPSADELEILQETTGLSSTDILKCIRKQQRKIFKNTQPQYDYQNNPPRKRKRIAKGSGYRAALEVWVQENEGRLWQTDEELKEILQSLFGICSNAQVASWFAYRRKKARLELEHAIKDPRGFIARNGRDGKEILFQFFEAIRSGATTPQAGQTLVGELTGLPLKSIAQICDASRGKPYHAHELDPGQIQERNNDVDLEDEAVDRSDNLPNTPTGNGLLFNGKESSPVAMTMARPFPTDALASSDSPDTCCVFPEPFITFVNPLTAAQSCGRCWTTYGIKSKIGSYIQRYHGAVPTSDPSIGDLTLVVSQKRMGFTFAEVLSVCQPQQSLQRGTEISPEFVFPHAPFPLLRGTADYEAMASKILDCQDGVRYSCLYCDEFYYTAFDLAEHLQLHTRPFYLCPVAHCRAHLGEFRMTCTQLYAHLQKHKANDEFLNGLEWMPYSKHYWIRQPQNIRRHVTILAKRKLLDASYVETGTKESLPTGAETSKSRTSQNEWYRTMKQQAIALGQSDMDRSGEISEELELQVLSYNLQKQRYCRSFIHACSLNSNLIFA